MSAVPNKPASARIFISFFHGYYPAFVANKHWQCFYRLAKINQNKMTQKKESRRSNLLRSAMNMKVIVPLTVIMLFPGLLMAFDPEGSAVFDAHIHYSQDVWASIPPEEAIHRLREAGIARAMVSSTSDEGTQRLYAADPELIIPVLRPYRKRGTIRSWMHDQTVVAYLKQRLAKYRYVAIGEFHVEGAEADLPVVRAVVQLAKQHDLILHVHADADAVRRIFKHDPQAEILWAHAGFEYAHVVRSMLDRHKNLWADLSFRREVYTNGRFLHGWRELLIAHSDRFMLATDPYTPQRWLKLQSVMMWQRSLLEALPEEVAARIAWNNGERLFTQRFSKKLHGQ
jgi:predicted TIM-barrel fold metal-dependent hydrolase